MPGSDCGETWKIDRDKHAFVNVMTGEVRADLTDAAAAPAVSQTREVRGLCVAVQDLLRRAHAVEGAEPKADRTLPRIMD